MHWQTKSRIFSALEKIPLGDHVHFLMQKTVTREWPRRLDVLYDLLSTGRKIVQMLGNRDIRASEFLEIGAGRDLATAVALRLLGARHITCVDISKLATPALIQHAANHMASVLQVPAPQLRSWDDVRAFGIDYVAPTRLEDAGLEDRSFDVFYSIDTLEHIPIDALRSVLQKASNLLKPDGSMVHFIDYSDHYARGNGLSRFNFLKFSESAWRKHNTRFQYVNRLRHSQYMELFQQCGLAVDQLETDFDLDQEDVLQGLAPEFRKFSPEDLFTLRSRVVASRA